MNSKLLERSELFDRNNEILFKKYWIRFKSIVSIASIIFTDAKKEADADRMEEMEDILKERFGFFSNARSTMEIPLLATMAVQKDPEKYIDEVKELYEELMDRKIFRTQFDMLSAMILQSQKDKFDMKEMSEKIHGIYKKMQSNHPIITDKSDMTSATMFALCDKDEDALLDDMEECYDILKPEFGLFTGDEMQRLSAILALLDGEPSEKCNKVLNLQAELKERGMSVKHRIISPILGGLAAIDKPVKEIADEVEEVFEWLKGRKGFGLLEMGKEGRITYAMMLTVGQNVEDNTVTGDLMKSTLTSIALVEIMVLFFILVTASSNAANNNNK